MIDISGQKFGKLTANSPCGKNSKGVIVWACTCDCGRTDKASLTALRQWKTQCVKCSYSQRNSGKNNPNYQFGESHTRLYNVWYHMKKRCYDPNNDSYKNYGGRGIKVCTDWENSYQSFAKWARNNGYKDGLEIDRIDNDGDYCPQNCRWATKKEQANNRRSSRFVQLGENRVTVAQAADILGIGYNDAYAKAKSNGWELASP